MRPSVVLDMKRIAVREAIGRLELLKQLPAVRLATCLNGKDIQ
jgi:hypothetical protein